MRDGADNPFLARVMRAVRRGRPRLDPEQVFFNRVEKVREGNYVELWFLTGGCTWDGQGGCTMCNYGRGHRLTADETVAAVRRGLDAIDVPVAELLVSPSGGMLDPLEVPPGVRRRIYDLVRVYPTPKFLIETRAETVGPYEVAELVASVPGKRLGVELGLESSCPWVLRYCVNKGSGPDDFARAAGVLRAQGVAVYANVSLGTAFLEPAEAVEDAVRTARWALAQGADTIVLFPLHVKPYTLLDVMHAGGRYRSPSLWSLVEVLSRLGPECWGRVEIAWYRSYYTDAGKTRVTPSTCPACQARVVELLDEYRARQSPESVAALVDLDCRCRTAWADEQAARPSRPLARRVAEHYDWLAERYALGAWWDRERPALFAAMADGTPDLTSLAREAIAMP